MSLPVICGCCRRHIYDYIGPMPPEGRYVIADEFEPVEGVPKPVPNTRMECPFCGAYWLKPVREYDIAVMVTRSVL